MTPLEVIVSNHNVASAVAVGGAGSPEPIWLVGNGGHFWPSLPLMSLQPIILDIVGELSFSMKMGLSVLIVDIVVIVVGLQNWIGCDHECTLHGAMNQPSKFASIKTKLLIVIVIES